jgi:ribosome-binding factor A
MAIKHRKESMENVIKDLACDFFARESNKKSLLTITRAMMTEDMKTCIIYISVFPEKEEIAALHFTKRQRKDFQEFLRKKMQRQFVPFIDIEIDKGEKILNRMRDLGL